MVKFDIIALFLVIFCLGTEAMKSMDHSSVFAEESLDLWDEVVS